MQLHGIPLGAMKNIKLGEGSLPTTETKDMEMVVGNMVAQNFSNAKTGKRLLGHRGDAGHRFYQQTDVYDL